MSIFVQYNISRYRPLLQIFVLITVGAAAAATAWVTKPPNTVYQEPADYSIQTTTYASLRRQVAAMKDAYNMLQEENTFMLKEREEIGETLIQLEQASTIDKRAISAVRAEMIQLQDQIFDLRRELEFYRGIMDTTQTATGLQIQGWYTRTTGTDNQYRYKIVLTNLSNADKDAAGLLRASIIGNNTDGAEKILALKTVLTSDDEFSFKFRNFKVFEGHIQLPQEFEPVRVRITLTSKDGKKNLAEKELDWASNKI